jgi:hypothetical protein
VVSSVHLDRTSPAIVEDFERIASVGRDAEEKLLLLGAYYAVQFLHQNARTLEQLAFDLADKYRMTSLVLGDGYLGQMTESLVLPEPSGLAFDKSGWALTGLACVSSLGTTTFTPNLATRTVDIPQLPEDIFNDSSHG